MLSRRYNIRTPAEIQAERAASRPKPEIIITKPQPRYRYLTPEQKIERDQKIKELRIAGKSEIAGIVDAPDGTVASAINKLGLQGIGGKCKRFIKRQYKNLPIGGHP